MKQHQQALEYPKLKYFTSGLEYGQALIAYHKKLQQLAPTPAPKIQAQKPSPNPYLLSPQSYRREQNLLDLQHDLELVRQKQEQAFKRYQAQQQLLSRRRQQLKRSQKQFEQLFIIRLHQEHNYQNQRQRDVERSGVDGIGDRQREFLERRRLREVNFQNERRRIQQDNASKNMFGLTTRHNIANNKMEIQNHNSSLQSLNTQKNQEQNHQNPQEGLLPKQTLQTKPNQIPPEQNQSSLFKGNTNLFNRNSFQATKPNQPNNIEKPNIWGTKKQSPKMVGIPQPTNIFGQPVMPCVNIFGNNRPAQNTVQKSEIQNKPLFGGDSSGQVQPAVCKPSPSSPKIAIVHQQTQAKTQQKSARNFINQIKIQKSAIWNETLPQQKSAVENYKRVDAQLANSGQKSNLFSENKPLSAQTQQPKKRNIFSQQKAIEVNQKPSEAVQKVEIEPNVPPKNVSDNQNSIFHRKVNEPSNMIKKPQVPQNLFNKPNQVVPTLFVSPPQGLFSKPTQTTNNMFSKKPAQTTQNWFNKPKQATANFFTKPAQKVQNIQIKISQPQNLFKQAKNTDIFNKPNNNSLTNQQTDGNLQNQHTYGLFKQPTNNNLFNQSCNPNIFDKVQDRQSPNPSTNLAKEPPTINPNTSAPNLFNTPSNQPLFARPPTNLFTQLPAQPQSLFPQPAQSLFTSTLNTQNNMFTNKPKNTDPINVFTNNANKANTNENEDQDQEDQELQKEQEMGGDPRLSNANFQYEQAEVLFREDASRFKIVNDDVLIQNVRISFEKYPNSNNTLFIVRLANKVVSFTGLILPGKTQVTPMKDNPLAVSVKNILKIEGSVKKSQNLRILFKTAEAANKFLQVGKQRLTIR